MTNINQISPTGNRIVDAIGKINITGKLSNVLYIELIPDILMNLTYPDSEDGGNIPESTEISSTTYLEKTEEVLENSPTPTRENSNTYTENTPKKIDHGFKERDYDWDRLEAELFNQNL